MDAEAFLVWKTMAIRRKKNNANIRETLNYLKGKLKIQLTFFQQNYCNFRYPTAPYTRRGNPIKENKISPITITLWFQQCPTLLQVKDRRESR